MGQVLRLRYVWHDFYTVVPADEPVEVGDLLDAQGKPADTGYSLLLVGYDTDSTGACSSSTSAPSADDLFQPGTYLRVSASGQIVLNRR